MNTVYTQIGGGGDVGDPAAWSNGLPGPADTAASAGGGQQLLTGTITALSFTPGVGDLIDLSGVTLIVKSVIAPGETLYGVGALATANQVKKATPPITNGPYTGTYVAPSGIMLIPMD